MLSINRNALSIAGGWWLPAAAAASIGIAAISAARIHAWDVTGFVVSVIAAAVVYLCATILVLRRQPQRRDLTIILLAALVMRGIALLPDPNLSTDAFRYVWDGRVQAAGFSPYLHVPADPQLAHLRDETIYPNINQKERAVTIYPPVAELIFHAAHWVDVALPGNGLNGIRTVMLALDIATILAVVALLSALGLARERVLIYAWHPLPIWEFVAQSHIDVAATLVIVLGLVAAVRGRQSFMGMAFALGALVKYYPVVLLPALWRRFDWRAPLAFVITVAVLYAPFVKEAGRGVLGFLGSHLDNEGYGAGWGFHPIWLLRDFNLADPPARAYIALALVVLTGLALNALFARRADEIRFDRLLVLGGAFVFLTSPHYPWYFVFLVPLLAVTPRQWALAMTLLAPLLYLPRPPGGVTWTELYLAVFWLPLAIGLASVLWRCWRSNNGSVEGT